MCRGGTNIRGAGKEWSVQGEKKKKQKRVAFSLWLRNFLEISFFFLIFIFTFFYNTVLVLPYIDMNPPRVYMSLHSYTVILLTMEAMLWQTKFTGCPKRQRLHVENFLVPFGTGVLKLGCTFKLPRDLWKLPTPWPHPRPVTQNLWGETEVSELQPMGTAEHQCWVENGMVTWRPMSDTYPT